MMADSIEHVISYWIIFQKFHSPALGGFAVLSHWLPFLFFSVYSGALADRFDPRRIIQLGMLLFMAASLGWGLLFLTGSLEMWHAAALLVVHGFAGLLWAAAALLPMIRSAAQSRVIVSMTLLAGGASLLVGNAYQAQMPEFARDLGHGDADFTYSMLLAADAAGALVAGLVLESRGLLPPHARTAFLLAMLWCLAIGSFAAATSYPLALALLFIAGFFELSFNAMAQTLVQVHAPSEVRGRIIGLFAMASLGLRAFSGVTVGLGGSLIGIHWSLAASAAALLALTMTLFSLTLRARS